MNNVWTLLFWISVLLSIGSVLLLLVLTARIPPDYLTRDVPEKSFQEYSPLVRILLIIGKNAFGWLLILAGTVMLFTPGQGTLFIALGVLLIDIRGKQAIVRRVVGWRGVLQAINKIREKAGQPPLKAPKD